MPGPPSSRPRLAAAGRLAAASDAAVVDGSSAALSKSIAAGRSSGILQLSARGLTAVPEAVYNPDAAADAAGGAWWEMAELTRLDLSRNEIEQLPEGLFGPACSTLTSLDLSQNKLRGLPPGLAQLGELRSLSVSSNPLGGAAAAASSGAARFGGRGGGISAGAARYGGSAPAMQAAAEAAATAGSGGAGGLPDDVSQLPALASLSCAACGLEVLPESLGDARVQPLLSQLQAAANRLVRLPIGLARASALVKLELQGNCLSELDGRMVIGWASLQELDLSENQLQVRVCWLGWLCLSHELCHALPF